MDSLGQALLLPNDMQYFAEGSDETVSLRLKWHTIAVSSKLFPFLLIGLLSLFQLLT